MELNQVTRERNDLSNQLTVLGRKRDALNDELIRTRQKLEQANETNARVNRNLEDLVKECEEKQCALDALDKDMQRLQEQLAAVRSEKEALEAVLFDTQTNLEASEAKKFQLESEQQELLVKQEQLKAQIARLTKDLERSEKRCIEVKNSLLQQSGNKEMEFKQTIEKLKSQNEDNIKKLTEEREKIRTTLEKRLQQSLQQLTHEKDAEIQQLIDRIESLQNHIDNMVQQHEELMLRAENDKQKALLIGKTVDNVLFGSWSFLFLDDLFCFYYLLMQLKQLYVSQVCVKVANVETKISAALNVNKYVNTCCSITLSLSETSQRHLI